MKKPSKTAVEQRLIGESCIECHACCHHLVLKLKPQDLGRSRQAALAAEEYEPGKYRLMPRKRPDDRRTYRKIPAWNFYCPLLAGSSHCNIYGTRPDACRLFKRESTACHAQRRLHRHANQG